MAFEEDEQRIAPPVNAGEQHKSAPLPVGKKVVLGIMVVLAVLLIAAGVVLLNQKPSEPSSEPSAAVTESNDSEKVPSSADKPEKADSATESEDASNDQGGDQKDSGSSASSGNTPSDAKASQTGQTGGKSSSTSSQDSNTAGDASKDTITVTISIDASNAGSSYSSVSMSAKTVTLKKGSDVYDALVATGAAIGGDSTYVKSINGLAEMQCGSLSGWMYSVNGVFPNVSCGDYELTGGETILWGYTCDLGEDLK